MRILWTPVRECNRRFQRPPAVEAHVDVSQAHEQHREYLKSLPYTPYPLEPTGDKFEVQENQRITNEPLGQR